MILEYDLRPSFGPRDDLKHLQMGLAVVLFQSKEVLRVIRYCKLVDPSTGTETDQGLAVAEFSATKQFRDDDIKLGTVRYATASGVKIRAFYPDSGELLRLHDLHDAYDLFLGKPRNADRPQVKAMVRNRIRKYLS